MACSTCKCDAGLSNTGTTCTPVMQVTKKIILVPYFDSTGAKNGINLITDTIDAAFISAKVNHADKSKRWFPLPEIKNVADVREENKVEAFEDGSSVFITEGNRSFLGLLVKGSQVLKGKIESARCVEIGAYLVDKNGNLIGSKSGNFLYPIKLDEASVAALLVKTTDSTIQKIQLGFNFHSDESDENLQMIACDETTTDLLQIKGLLDIYSTYSLITTTSFKAKLFTDYGTTKNPVVDKGLVIGDFALYNVTDALAVTILSVTEAPDGFYAFTFAAQGSVESLRLTPTKSGRDYSAVISNLIVTP